MKVNKVITLIIIVLLVIGILILNIKKDNNVNQSAKNIANESISNTTDEYTVKLTNTTKQVDRKVKTNEVIDENALSNKNELRNSKVNQ